MKILFQARVAAIFFAGGFLTLASQAFGISAPAERYQAPIQEAPEPTQRSAIRVPVGLSIQLPPLETARSAETASRTGIGPRRIGVGRELPTELAKVLDTSQLGWVSDGEGGLLARVDLQSGEAKGVRVGIQVFQIPDTVSLSFFQASGSKKQATVVTGREINASLARDRAVRDPDDPNPLVYWSPLVDGDALAVEIHLPAGLKPSDLEIAPLKLSHLFAGALDSTFIGVGDSQGCTIDYQCKTHVWGTVGPAVARMVFTLSSGDTSLCTGTLINDLNPDHQLPYFLTARHCISDQNVASSLQTYWFFRSQVCDEILPNSGVQVRSGGAMLLKDLEKTDATLLLLNDSPPDGTVLAGWSTDRVPLEHRVIGISHPAGDLKKISFGRTKTYGNCYLPPNTDSPFIFCSETANGEYVRVRYSYGMVEGGSSGSALFRDDTQQIVGTLTGGSDTCDSVAGEIYYGRFERSYEEGFEQWLAATDNECSAEPGSWAYCSNPACGPCGQGEGDCDSDQECADGLVCSSNMGADYDFSATTDICLPPSVTEPQGCRREVGDVDYCADPACGPCAVTEGDCDNDSECVDGLICLEDVGEAHGFAATVDVCSERPEGACPHTRGDWEYCADPLCGPCRQGQGDCDSNADCADGLVCAFDVGADHGFAAAVDVCVEPTVNACQKEVGDWGYCTDPACGPCSLGQGDCDSNAECADGLICGFNSGASYGLPANMDVCTTP